MTIGSGGSDFESQWLKFEVILPYCSTIKHLIRLVAIGYIFPVK